MKIGDILEPASMWYNADHPKEKEAAERGIESVLTMMAEEDNVVIGPIEWETLDPMSPRLPEPPGIFQGTIRCRVGYAYVVAHKETGYSMSGDLSDEDRETMRIATRKKWAQVHGEILSDEDCDKLLDQVGPEAAAETIHQ